MSTAWTAEALLEQRLGERSESWVDVHSTLRHFALINYAVPAERLRAHIPGERFQIQEFPVHGQPMALVSAVPFLDLDFRFDLAPFLRFQFGQTNYRAYVIDRQTGEPVVWFFGTTLGSRLVHVARLTWKIPWHFARYQIRCDFDSMAQRYRTYCYRVRSTWGDAQIELADTGKMVTCQNGFHSLLDMELILTHPTAGFYYRTDGRLGTYSVWHEKMVMTVAEPVQLYFGLFERLQLLSRDEMAQPHSAFLCPQVSFDVHLPPRLA